MSRSMETQKKVWQMWKQLQKRQIPLFMFWLNFGWFIILIGAEFSYAFQNVDNYNLDTK